MLVMWDMREAIDDIIKKRRTMEHEHGKAPCQFHEGFTCGIMPNRAPDLLSRVMAITNLTVLP